LAENNRKSTITLAFLPGLEIIKPRVLNILKVTFEKPINNRRVSMITVNEIPDEAFYGESKNLKKAIRELLEVRCVTAIKLGEYYFQLISHDDQWQLDKEGGYFQQIMACINLLKQDIEAQGFMVEIVLLNPVKVEISGNGKVSLINILR
jgi:hypothetical protein